MNANDIVLVAALSVVGAALLVIVAAICDAVFASSFARRAQSRVKVRRLNDGWEAEYEGVRYISAEYGVWYEAGSPRAVCSHYVARALSMARSLQIDAERRASDQKHARKATGVML